MEPTDEQPPLDLYERYLQQRRLAVPAAAISWGVMLLVGLAGMVALALRHRVSPAVLGVVGALTTALPWLAIGLLLVGHLPSLTCGDRDRLPRRVRRSRRRVHGLGDLAARDLRRARRHRRSDPRAPRHRGRARLAGRRDAARRRGSARRRPLLRDAEHRDRHRARLGAVRGAPDPRRAGLPPPGGLRPRGGLAVDGRELRRGDHALRRRGAVARGPPPAAVVARRPDHRSDHGDRDGRDRGDAPVPHRPTDARDRLPRRHDVVQPASSTG